MFIQTTELTLRTGYLKLKWPLKMPLDVELQQAGKVLPREVDIKVIVADDSEEPGVELCAKGLEPAVESGFGNFGLDSGQHLNPS